MENILGVILEVASSKEIVAGGRGWIVSAGLVETLFGTCLIGQCPRGICHVSFDDSADGAAEMVALQAAWPQAQLWRDDTLAQRLAARIFSHNSNGGAEPLHVFVHGTSFQIEVWRALLQVPWGTLVSYGHIAMAIGRSKAVRAVGTAVGKNPVSVLIPCHRVIRENGEIGHYHWGVERKRALIAWERAEST